MANKELKLPEDTEDSSEASEKSDDAIDRISKTMKKVSRDSDPYKGKRRGGLHGTPKGKKGYNRKDKHKKSFGFWVAADFMTREDLLKYSDQSEARPCGDGSKGGETYPEKCVGPGSSGGDDDRREQEYAEEMYRQDQENRDVYDIAPPDTSFLDKPKIAPAPQSQDPHMDQERDRIDMNFGNMGSYRQMRKYADMLGLHDEGAEDLALELESEQVPSGEGMSAMHDYYMNLWEQKYGGGAAQSGQQLTPTDETYRHMKFPLATASWFAESWEPNSIVALLDWSTHKAETFKDTGEKGEHPAWGMKSIIDRGVKPHEKPEGDKRIGEAENQTQKRNIKSKSFKSYSMVENLRW